MPTRQWLNKHYAHLPKKIQLVLINYSLKGNVRILTKLISEYPKIYPLHACLEDRFIALGSKTLALKKWHKTSKTFPRLASAYFRRASWALKKSEFIEAALFLRLCIMVDRGYFRDTAHFWRAEALCQLGRYSAAKGELENLPDDYEDFYFLDYVKSSKADLLNDICIKENHA